MKRNCAVFTICQNEAAFLPLWLRYYSRHFDPADVYVLDHGSVDGSVERAWREFRPNVVRVHRYDSFDHRWLRDTVQAFQRFLLQSHANVLFAEVDEFVAADPLEYPGGLRSYVETNTRPVVRCLGYNVVQQPGEAAVDWARPVLAQRSTMWLSELYSKPLLTRVPVTWVPGFHALEDYDLAPLDPHLLLLHLHRVDRDTCLARHRSAAARPWSAYDRRLGLGSQNRVVDPAEFATWFDTWQLGEQRHGIPEHLKEVL